ncbi:MAG: contact-dependent growth inhibition system immunity protein [Alcaligenaceae bacterium]|nr:contact-dependent growth inhibition system immunity protein [Alcaligenaceae bacterium]
MITKFKNTLKIWWQAIFPESPLYPTPSPIETQVMPRHEYEDIDQLMGCYFNQDMCIICDCDSIEEAVAYFVADYNEQTLNTLLREMTRFEADFPDDLDTAFTVQFSPEVDVIPVSNFFSLIRSTIKQSYPHLFQIPD